MTAKLAGISKMTIPRLLSQAEPGRSIYSNRIHPSSASCERQITLRLTQQHAEKLDSTPNLALDTYAKEGYVIEDIIISRIQKQGRLIAPMDKKPIWVVIDAVNLLGKMDGLARMPNENGDDELFGLEIKSCSQLPHEIEDHHKAQVGLYAAITGLPFVELYVMRSPPMYKYESSIREFYYRPTDVQNIHWISLIYRGFLANKFGLMPDRPFTDDSGKICQYCPFCEICWNGELDAIYETQDYDQLASITEQAEIFAVNFNKYIDGRRGSFLSKYGIKS